MINKQVFRWSAVACFTAWLAVGALPAAAAGMYKWTDDQGIVHYSDQLPADAVNKGGTVFDKQGRQIKKIDATLTPAQAKAKEAEDERLRLLAKTQEDKSRRDLALMHSYTSEEEIDFARSRALLAVESQLKSAEAYIGDLSKRQQELRKDKLAYGTKPVPPTLDTELTGLDEELARQDKVLAQRRAEIASINAKYESDKQRWREIRTDQGKPPAAAAANTPPPPPAPSKGSSTPATK
jgi:chromosome segregation ATPase